MDEEAGNGMSNQRGGENALGEPSGEREVSAPLPAISVIIPTYNRRESLRATLQGLAAQTVPAGTFEALVISDGATDGTAALCATLSAAPDLSYSLRYFEQDHQGPSAARNLGMRQARAPLLLFLDDDVVPDPTLVGEHLRLLREQPGAVVIGPLLLPPGVRLQPWVRWESERLLTQYAHMRRGLWEPTPSQFYTGNASLARAAALTVGGFDVTFPRAEDVELAYRLRDHGLRFIFAPDARGWHYAQRSFRSWLRTPWLYGEADAAMSLRQGRNEILERMCSGYWERRRVIRGLARLCVGRWPLRVGVVGVGGALANVAGALPGDAGYSLASAALSVIFNLSYWQSLAKHIGRRHFWDLIYGRAHPVPAPLLAGKAPTTR